MRPLGRWQGDEVRLQQLCQLFDLGGNADNAIQQQVMTTLNEFSQWPDFNMYLVTVFAVMPGVHEVVRQRAGLVLKENLKRSHSHTDYVQVITMTAIRDPSRVIRHTAGTVITTIVSEVGVRSCYQILDQLAECLNEANVDIVEGSFNALNKVCEDGVTMLKQYCESSSEETEPFVRWCTSQLLPRIFEYCTLSAPDFARLNAVECLNHFVLSGMFQDSKYSALMPFAERYVQALGVLANDRNAVVLQHVCKGFVYVVECGWGCLTEQTCPVVLQFMLRASQHEDYSVRLEALEVWTPCTNHGYLMRCVEPMLPELVPVLLANMVYSSHDYMGMEKSRIQDDNAADPDLLTDIPPKFHKEQGDDSNDGSGREAEEPWGDEWTARKAAASSLDQLANAFQQDILQIVLPLIEQKLQDTNWEVQESGVLALGAIAMGCMDGLVNFLPRVIEMLLNACQAPKPLLRSISCWCISRFSQWICHYKNPGREEVLRSVLQTFLQLVLDKNKKVQQGACSAFATLEEEAQFQLVPYLDSIVETLARAFQYYQARNLLILYDAVGTLAESVGSDLRQPKYMQALLDPLMQKFDSILDSDRSLISLFECLSVLSQPQNLGPAMLPVVPRIVQRCIRLTLDAARAAQMWQQNPNEFEKPDREVMAASIDLLSSIVDGLQDRIKEVLVQQNFIVVIPECLRDTALQVKQSAFALMGDCAKNCCEYLVPFLPQLLPLCAASLEAGSSAVVSNNASWAIGEVCVKVGPEIMAPHLDKVVRPLINILHRNRPGQQMLVQNVCITLGRLGLVCAPQMDKMFSEFARTWCIVMKRTKLDDEKITAFQGVCYLIKANPQACLTCVPELIGAICSFAHPPPQLEPSFREILTEYKKNLGANWMVIHGQLPNDVKMMLSNAYGLHGNL